MPKPDAIVIGLGAMGLPMARNIQAAGLDVAGLDPALAGHTSQDGIRLVDDLPAELSSVVLLVMVASGAQLTSVVDSVAGRDLTGSTWVISSTVGRASVREQAERLLAGGAAVVDAPVTGGVAGARAGSLLMFVSGAAQHIEAASTVLGAVGNPEIVGKHIGDGQTLKAVNQLLCSIHLVAAAEAMAVVGQLDIDQTRALELLGRGGAASWMLNDRGPRMIQRPVDVRSAISVFVKDSGIAAEAADAAGVETPLLAVAADQFAKASSMGLSAADDWSVIDCYATRPVNPTSETEESAQ